MIVYYLLQAIISVIHSFFIVDLPFFVNNFLLTATGYYHSFMLVFPPAVLPFTIFVTIILPFELIMLVAKFFLGHRLPAHGLN